MPVSWRPMTSTPFQQTPRWDWSYGIPEAYFLCTDGAINKKQEPSEAGCAVILLCAFGGRLYYVDAWAAHISSPSTSVRAELGATTVAIVIASSWPRHPQHTVLHFCFDAHVAGYTAAGVWMPNHHLHQQGLKQALIHWLEQEYYKLQWDHIPAHTGEPWNEAADTLAYEAAHHLIQVPDIAPWLQQVVEHKSHLEWLWFFQQPGIMERLRWIQGRRHLCLPVSMRQNPTAVHHPIMQRRQTEGVEITESAPVLLGTANTLTLHPKGDGDPAAGTSCSARMEDLLSQCHERGYHLVGLQETRSKLQGYLRTARYHVISSPAFPEAVVALNYGLRLCGALHRSTKAYQASARHVRVPGGSTTDRQCSACDLSGTCPSISSGGQIPMLLGSATQPYSKSMSRYAVAGSIRCKCTPGFTEFAMCGHSCSRGGNGSGCLLP